MSCSPNFRVDEIKTVIENVKKGIPVVLERGKKSKRTGKSRALNTAAVKEEPSTSNLDDTSNEPARSRRSKRSRGQRIPHDGLPSDEPVIQDDDIDRSLDGIDVAVKAETLSDEEAPHTRKKKRSTNGKKPATSVESDGENVKQEEEDWGLSTKAPTKKRKSKKARA